MRALQPLITMIDHMLCPQFVQTTFMEVLEEVLLVTVVSWSSAEEAL